MPGMFRGDFTAAVRGLVEGAPAGTDPAVVDAYVEKMVAVRQPAGLRAIEGLVRGDTDAALRETEQPVAVLAIRDLVAQEAIDRYGDRLDIVLVDLGGHHLPVESPEAAAKPLADVEHPERLRQRIAMTNRESYSL
ncbi:hypothetical protein [Streptomyces sp. E2N166]|uniref:hypothetical protein n=1 Tax=Streptomyces sp. E2N166 TaxID=1851909 RepID=UPI00187D4782|nr:hypothetical protein [Streptomyces sp. E2N166]